MKKKLISLLVMIVLISLAILVPLQAQISRENYSVVPVVECCHLLSFYRIEVDEHVFGYDAILDELFDLGSSFVDVIMYIDGETIITEFWCENTSILQRAGCRPMQHVGPIFVLDTITNVLHSGGGSTTPGGVVCAQVTIRNLRCGACHVVSRETSTFPIFCRSC